MVTSEVKREKMFFKKKVIQKFLSIEECLCQLIFRIVTVFFLETILFWGYLVFLYNRQKEHYVTQKENAEHEINEKIPVSAFHRTPFPMEEEYVFGRLTP
jgi:cbb3-type cytochrome oxidase subunit 3